MLTSGRALGVELVCGWDLPIRAMTMATATTTTNPVTVIATISSRDGPVFRVRAGGRLGRVLDTAARISSRPIFRGWAMRMETASGFSDPR